MMHPNLSSDKLDRPRSELELIFIIAFLAAFAPLSTDMYLPAFPEIETYFATSSGNVQLSLSSFFAAFALGQLVFGPLSDQFGRKRPLYCGLLLFLASSLSCIFAPNIWVLIGLRFLQGLGACAGAVISLAIVRDVFDGSRAVRTFSILAIVGGLAPMVSPVLGGFLLRVASWKMIFWVLVVVGLFCLAATSLRLPETARRKKRAVRGKLVLGAYWHVLKNPRFTLFTLGLSFTLAGLFAFISGSPFVFMKLYGLSPWQYGVVFACNVVAMIIAANVNAMFVAKISPQKLLKTGSRMQVCFGLILLVTGVTGWGGMWGILIPIFCFSLCINLIIPNATALAMAPFKRCAGTASALLGAMQFAIASLTAMSMGLVGGNSALPMACAIALCGILGCVCRHFAEQKSLGGKTPAGDAEEALPQE